MKGQSNDSTSEMRTMEIRESKLSGQFFFQRWLAWPQRMKWIQAFRKLTSQEKITLIENIAWTRFACLDRQMYFQIFSCCYYLEKVKLMQQFAREMREKKIELTSQNIRIYSKSAQSGANKRIKELGLNLSFNEVMQIKKSMEQSKLKQKDQSFSEGFEQKTSKPIQNFNKTSQSFFARLKSIFTRQKSGIKQSFPEPTMEYIQLDKNDKEQS